MGHEEHAKQFRIGRPGDAGVAGAPQPEVFEGLVLLAVGEIHGRRTAERPGTGHSRRRVPDTDQRLRLRIRQGLDQDAVDHGKDSGIRANTKRQRQDDGSREGGSLSHAPERMPRITQERLEERESSLVPIGFLDGFYVAELQQSLPTGFNRRQASSKILCRLHGDVVFDFGPQEFFVPR